MTEQPWWRDAVVYQVHVRSFGDADGDGIGDLEGVRYRLGYLELLGVDALRLTPFHPSPTAGGDAADPRAVDPVFGDLDDLDALVAEAHAHGLRVVMDLVGNHTSIEHEWFRAARESAPGSPERARYHVRPGRPGADGAVGPPNGWRSVLGGPAWTELGDGEWYLHLFSPDQPDLNWANPEVRADLEKTARFWLDRGVDGFRLDVAHGMSKPEGLPDAVPGRPDPRFDDDGVHDVHRMLRAVVDDHPDRLLAGALCVPDDRLPAYLRPDELHAAHTDHLLNAPFGARPLRAAIEAAFTAVRGTGALPGWAVSDHDAPRPVTRFGGGATGLARARAMALVQLALPGMVHLYNGEELGLPDADLPDGVRWDPCDGTRVPLPWEGGPPGFGFTTGAPWLPIPADWTRYRVADQLEDTTSTLSVYRRALELRRHHPQATGDGVEWYGAPEGCFAFRRTGSTLVCALNTSPDPVRLPPGDVLLSSSPMIGDLLPPDSAAWLA